MKIIAIVAGVLLAFACAVYALWHMVGGQVETAGARVNRQVPLDVTLTLVDAGGQPISDAPVRLVVGPSPERQSPTAGQALSTDAGGRIRTSVTAQMDKLPKDRPTNFLDSLFSRPEAADHLVVGVELGYMTFRWLYVLDLFRFQQDGDVLTEGARLFTRDEQGRFTREAKLVDGGWDIADLGGLRLTTQGYVVTDFTLAPKPDAPDAWTLSLAFTRQAEPVRR